MTFNNFEKIRFRAIEPVVSETPKEVSLTWHIVIEPTRPIDLNLGKYSDRVIYPDLTIGLRQLAENKFSLLVIYPTGLSYEVAWGASFRALLLLENEGAEISQVCGVARPYLKKYLEAIDSLGYLDNDKTSLMMACQHGNLAQVKQLLLNSPEGLVNELSPLGYSALTYASRKGNLAIAQVLLECGAIPDTRGQELTTLQAAVMSSSTEVVRLLLTASCDVNTQNRYGETALMLASALGSVEITQLLLSHGADSTKLDIWGETAKDKALINSHGGIISLLEQSGF